jgi:hypothetical protein
MTGDLILKNWFERLHRPVDIDWLVFLRCSFGLIAIYWCIEKFVGNGLVGYFIEPTFHFKFAGFEWVQPFSSDVMILELSLMTVAAFCLMIGFGYRIAALTFGLGFTHLFLIDRSLYLNHNYLIAMFSFAMAILPANRSWSLDAFLWKKFVDRKSATQPTPRSEVDRAANDRAAIQRLPLGVTFAWHLWLVRFIIGVPYFFGGLAKLSPDWLAGRPMREVVAKIDVSWMTWFTQIDGVYWLFAYGGLIFDLLIVPMLLFRKTRLIGFVFVFAFHLTNHFIFHIGVFPWFMMATTFVFLDPGWLRHLLTKSKMIVRTTQESRAASTSSFTVPRRWTQTSWRNRAAFSLAALFVIVQCLLPFRSKLAGGDPNWTERGHYFCWHMLLRGKTVGLQYYATDPKTGRTGIVDPTQYLSLFQLLRFGKDPEMIRQLAVHIKQDLERQNIPDPEIRAVAYVSLNGRKPALMIDPNCDLTQVEPDWRAFSTPDWILPNDEPLPKKSWEVPVNEWPRYLPMPERFQPDRLAKANARANAIMRSEIDKARRKSDMTSTDM